MFVLPIQIKQAKANIYQEMKSRKNKASLETVLRSRTFFQRDNQGVLQIDIVSDCLNRKERQIELDIVNSVWLT